MSPLDVVDDLEDQVEEEGECDFDEEYSLVVVEVAEGFEGCGECHLILNYKKSSS